MLTLQILPVSHSRKLLVLGLTLAVCETSWSTPHALYYHLVMFIDSFIFFNHFKCFCVNSIMCVCYVKFEDTWPSEEKHI